MLRPGFLALCTLAVPASAQEVGPLSIRHLSALVGPTLDPSDPGLGWTISCADDPD